MTYDARQIANWFVNRAARDEKVMSMLKLTYFAHGWNLETKETPLFSNRVEAWQHGPVIGMSISPSVRRVSAFARQPRLFTRNRSNR